MFTIFHTFAGYGQLSPGISQVKKGQLASRNVEGHLVICDGSTRPIGIFGDNAGKTDLPNVHRNMTIYTNQWEGYIDLDLVDTYEIPNSGDLLAAGEEGTFTEPSEDFPFVVAQVIDDLKHCDHRLATGFPGEFTNNLYIRVAFSAIERSNK